MVASVLSVYKVVGSIPITWYIHVIPGFKTTIKEAEVGWFVGWFGLVFEAGFSM